jgi:hypothetical protein
MNAKKSFRRPSNKYKENNKRKAVLDCIIKADTVEGVFVWFDIL